MDKTLAKQFYEREDIKKALLMFAKSREIGVMFDGFFGKRPSVLENIQDINSLINKGVQSFHMSEERWVNPLLLDGNLSEDEKNKIREGWDLILDLDGVDFEFSKITGKLIVDHLTSLGVSNVSVKFSGNKGFHIGVPFEAFSTNIIGIGETRKLFPEVARKIAAYLMHELKGKISKEIIDTCGSVEKLCEKYNMKIEDVTIDDPDSLNLDFMKFIEIDTILIASRHLFRMPYSLNEKSGLVSVPVKKDKIMEFQRNWGNPRNVKPDYNKKFEFLAYESQFGKDGDILLTKAHEEDYMDFLSKDVVESMYNKNKGDIIEITEEVDRKDFPQTIQYMLNTSFQDGRKRALFVLLSYLFSVKWSEENIEIAIEDWNKLQNEPLKKNYIQAQVSWFKVQQKTLSTPNFDNDNYYKGIGVPEEVIKKDQNAFRNKKVKNPIFYTFLLLKKKNSGKKN